MEKQPKANEIQKVVKQTFYNEFNVPIEIEKEYCNRVNDYVVNEYNAAKLLIHGTLKQKLSIEDEKIEIEKVLKKGIVNYCKEIGIDVELKEVVK